MPADLLDTFTQPSGCGNESHENQQEAGNECEEDRQVPGDSNDDHGEEPTIQSS